MMARRAAAAEAREMEDGEEDMVSEALEENGNGNGAHSPPATSAAAVSGKTMSAKTREEMRLEKERDENSDELASFLAGICLPGKKYTFDLFRLQPASYVHPENGRLFFPGRPDGKGMFVAHYEDEPSIADIAEQHGGTEYSIAVKGPNKDDPKKISTTRYKFSILGDPKTLGTPQGPVPFAHAPLQNHQQAAQQDALASVTSSMMTMFRDMQKESREDLKAVLASVNTRPDPSADRLTLLKIEEDRAERQRAHEREMARIAADAAAKAKSEELRLAADRDARDAAEKERQRQHEKEIAILAATSAKQEAEDRRREAAEEKREQRHLEAMKEQRQGIEKLVEKITKDKDDPVEKILQTISLVEKIKGDKEGPDDGGTIGRVLEKAVPEVLRTADKFLARFDVGSRKEKKPAVQQDTVLALEAPAEEPRGTTTVVDETPPKPTETVLDGFEWPAPDTDIREQARMFSHNIELALAAKWNEVQIFKNIAEKFPQQLIDVITSDDVTEADIIGQIESNAPQGSLLISARGKHVMRMLYKALKKKKAGK